jgi:hypothetical protein
VDIKRCQNEKGGAIKEKKFPISCNKVKYNLCRLKNELAVRAPYANTTSEDIHEKKKHVLRICTAYNK